MKLVAPVAEKGKSRLNSNVKIMNNLNQFRINSLELNELRGGITRAEFKKVCEYLHDNEQYDQLVAVMKLYNSGGLQFED